MNLSENIQIEVLSQEQFKAASYDFDKAIFDINSSIDLLTSHADTVDCIVSAASGLLCGALDILWVGEFDLAEGREIASEKIDSLVQKTAKILGCKKTDIKDCVKFLEDKFPIPSDGNTSDFGGGLQHHLRDFAHHPTIGGLIFSLLTQFTGKAYGTDVNGIFKVVDVVSPDNIGGSIPDKLYKGTIKWFFHLVSDMAGSSSTAGVSGGTGIPGPILSLAKEMSALPIFHNLNIGDNTLSDFLGNLFNGNLLAYNDENGNEIKDSVLKMDLRGELGCMEEMEKQTVPVIANECIVRVFYFIRRLAEEIRSNDIATISDFKKIEWKSVVPVKSPTLSRMLTIATGVFTTVDIAEAVITEKYWIAINYVGVARFAIAVNGELEWALKRADLAAIRKMYETIEYNTFTDGDNRMYKRMEKDMNADKLGLTLEETEILYNIEYCKTKNDIAMLKLPVGSEAIRELKKQWLNEWAEYMASGFDEFVSIPGAVLHWYNAGELLSRIARMNPTETWYKLVMLEAMLFEPYFPIGTEKDKKSNDVPSKKYKALSTPGVGFNSKIGDKYLEDVFSAPYCRPGFIESLRKCHSKVINELNEVTKTVITSLAIAAGTAVLLVATAGAFAPQIAVLLVGSEFSGLSGAALMNACLAYLGGGAIAAGGAGMAGGTIAIVGGGAILGLGAGAGAGGITAAVSIEGKKATIMQSAKLMVSVREIFLNEEKDIEYSSTILEQYVDNISKIEKSVVELKLKADIASKDEKKLLKDQIKNAEESADAMRIAMKSMNKFISAYKVGMGETV